MATLLYCGYRNDDMDDINQTLDEHYFLAGISSFGNPDFCGSYNSPSVYTSIAANHDWIWEKIGSLTKN